ncbi:MAG: response regulator transcription factor [Anaerolineae bacterium]|nr:MAG: response regulator transcription factor [Anaerolineae bacterium]
MKVLVVDDDRTLADVVAFTLRREGFQVIQAYDGEAALQCWAEEQPDLIVLDVNLPRLDGFAVCRHIRGQADTPILLLTVRDEEDDIVHGLELGADDYITKPFSPRQLVARAQAVLRRAGRTPVTAIRQIGDLMLDPSRRELRIGQGETVSLTPLESRLLDYLMLNAGHVLTAEAIIDHVWGAEGGDRDMLRQLVRRLRSKMAQACVTDREQPDPARSNYIETVPGLGYGLTLLQFSSH